MAKTSHRNNETYFAADESEQTADYLLTKSENFYKTIHSSGYLDKLKKLYAMYHGMTYFDDNNSHEITFEGEQGELTSITVNHIRNFGQNMLNLITASRPTMETRAINTDHRSRTQTILADGLLEYYMREKKLEQIFYKAAEYALSQSSAWIRLEWNAMDGEPLRDEDGNPLFDEETQTYLYEGDVNFEVISPYDVTFDGARENNNHDWVMVRNWKNKFDVIAKYPELEDQIREIETKTELEGYAEYIFSFEESTLIPVYEFYHRKSESVAEGRYMMFLNSDLILEDRPLPYYDIPLYRISPSDVLGTPYGYTPLFDLMPLQEAANMLYSTILTNQQAFGVQNIYVPRGADISMEALPGGLNIIEGNQNAGKPEPINLTNTPKEIFEYLQILIQTMETISGINSVIRGNPEANLRSGTSLALMQSNSIQFMSGLANQYNRLIEDVGTGLLKTLKMYANTKRVAAIVGEHNRSYIQEFDKEDLSNITRVVVSAGNPLARCLKEGTEILMHDGSKKKVENIEVGEQVMGPDSNPRTVESINSGIEPMYDIYHKKKKREFLYGCNESHILTLKYCSNDGRYGLKKYQQVDMSVREYLSLSKRHQRLFMGFRTGVEFEEQELPFDPYALGLWLGDGNADRMTITTADKVLEDYWINLAKSMGFNTYKYDQPNNNSDLIGFAKTEGKSHSHIIKNLNVYKNKHVPDIYKFNSRENRLKILAGFIDADGTLVDQTFCITQKSDEITNGFIYIAKSLGFKVTNRKRPSTNNKGEVVGECNHITIGGDTYQIPTLLKRKQAKKVQKHRDWLNYGIEVVPVGVGKYYGFTLKEEPHFLLGDFTVTHNTTAGRIQMASELLQYQLLQDPAQYISILETGNLDIVTEDPVKTENLITSENEQLLNGELPVMIDTDLHTKHINRHLSILDDAKMRQNPQLVQLVLQHVNEHKEALMMADPVLLGIRGETPIMPPMPPGAPQNLQDGAGNLSIPAGAVDPNALPNVPNPPAPPAGFEDQPITGEELQQQLRNTR